MYSLSDLSGINRLVWLSQLFFVLSSRLPLFFKITTKLKADSGKRATKVSLSKGIWLLHHVESVVGRFQGWYVFRLVSIFRPPTPVWPLSQEIFQQCVRCIRQGPVGRQLCPVVKINYTPYALYHVFFLSRDRSSFIRPAGKFSYFKRKRWGIFEKRWPFLWTPYCI